MSAAELKELRKRTKKYIDQADEKVVRMVCAMLAVDAEYEKEQFYLMPEQEAILDERMEKYENGEMEVSTWEDARARISSKIKNAV